MFKKFQKWTHPLIFHVDGSVFLQIWWKVLLMALYTSVIVCLHTYVEALRMTSALTLVSVLGVVTGLLLVFRTNTAYARYWEGRCLWSKMTSQIRHLTRLIWVGVAEGGEDGDETMTVKNVIEKTTAINLLVAFAFSTKNYLRDEYSYEKEDVKGLLGHLPKFRRLPKNQDIGMIGLQENMGMGRRLSRKRLEYKQKNQILASTQDHIQKEPHATICVSDNGAGNGNGEATIIKENNLEGLRKPNHYSVMAHAKACPTNIPIEVSFHLFSYVNNVVAKGLADGSATYFMYDSLMTLVDCMTGFERILRTPIPLAYGIHLHQAVWLFLLALPYQLVNALNWWTIPAVTLASFAFLGIMWIGREIENPFGYDDNDLPLDDYCKVIQSEIQMIVGNPVPSLDSWILSKNNFPMTPLSPLDATELMKMPLDDLRNILAKGALLLEHDDGDVVEPETLSSSHSAGKTSSNL